MDDSYEKTIPLWTIFSSKLSSHATYIDYRHEWLGDQHKQEDRIKMGHSLNNGIYFSVEGKWESKQGGFWDNLSSKGNEFELGYKYKLLDNLSITPSFALDSGNAIRHTSLV